MENATLTVDEILNALEHNLKDRKNKSAQDSYVAALYAKGLNKILEKVGEEATEVILAAKDYESRDLQKNREKKEEHTMQDLKNDLINECADLFFHTSVALSHLDVPIKSIFTVIEQRLNQSGLMEKKSRESKV